MSVRRFEFKDKKSSKFWQIALSDDGSTTVTFGRIGSAGQSKSKVHDDDDAAAAFFEKQIASKLKEGYVEVSTSTKRSAAAESAGSISFTDSPPYPHFKLSELTYSVTDDGLELRFDTLPPGPAHSRANKKKRGDDDDEDEEDEDEDDWFSKSAWDNYGPGVCCSEGALKPLHRLDGTDEIPLAKLDLAELKLPCDVVFQNDDEDGGTSSVSFSCCDHQFTKDNIMTLKSLDAATGALEIDWRGTIVMDSDEGKQLKQPHGFWLRGVAQKA